MEEASKKAQDAKPDSQEVKDLEVVKKLSADIKKLMEDVQLGAEGDLALEETKPTHGPLTRGGFGTPMAARVTLA